MKKKKKKMMMSERASKTQLLRKKNENWERQKEPVVYSYVRISKACMHILEDKSPSSRLSFCFIIREVATSVRATVATYVYYKS